MKILLLSILLFSSTLFGNIGKITALSGEVNISRDTQNIPATIGFILQEKDKVATKQNARVQLLFNDKTVISLGKNSTFDIEEYFYDTLKPENTKASFKVAKGIFKTITGQIGKVNPNKFTLKTRSASIGIRGTIFFGDVPPPETPEQPEVFSCSEGIIEVRTGKGIIQVGANQFTTVRPSQAPTPPQDMTPNQKKNLNQGSGAAENEQESGQDENIFFETSPLNGENQNPETGDFEVKNSNELAKNSINTLQNNTKFDDLVTFFNSTSSTSSTSSTNYIHYITLSSILTIEVEETPLNYSYITNDTITSKLGSGTIMKVTNNANDFQWGFWNTTGEMNGAYETQVAWILGENLVSDLSSLTSADNASYSGNIMGNYEGSLINPSNSTIKLDFDFGANTADVEFCIECSSTPTHEITNGTYSANGSTYTIKKDTDTLKGSFYDNMNKTAGTFDLGSIQAQGVYNATKD